MKASMQPGQGSSPSTPRRRGSSPQPATRDNQSEKSREETPVLLRLPDLYPSEAMDAAVERIEKQVAKKLPASSEREGRRQRSQIRVTSDRPPAPPTIKSGPDIANWNNRIIVTTFAITLLASGFMVIQRAARDHTSEGKTRAPASSNNDLEAAPSQRINRQSFQADSRARETGDMKRKQSSRGPTNSTAHIGSYSGSEQEYSAAPVSYEEPISQEIAPRSALDTDTYDLSIPNHPNRQSDIEQSQSLRLREENF